MTVVPNFKNPAAKKPQKKRQSITLQLDKTAGAIVRARGRCENPSCPRKSSEFQWAHGFSRSYRAVRWDLRNGFCLCKPCHVFFTHRPLQWDDFLRDAWGESVYAEIRALALAGGKVDHKAVLSALGEVA